MPCMIPCPLYDFMHLNVLPLCTPVQALCLVPAEVRRGHQMLWDWNYLQLQAIMQVLGMEPESSGNAISAPNC